MPSSGRPAPDPQPTVRTKGPDPGLSANAPEGSLLAGGGRSPAVGAVLAGGRGSRLGGSKATALLAGRPLISYPLAAIATAGLATFVVAKPDTELPPLEAEPPEGSAQPNPGAGRALEIVREPAQPSHPLVGIVAALRHAGRPVVVLACDMPFASPALLAALAGAGADRLAGEDEALVVPAPGGEAEPLQARWSPTLLPALEAALAREEPLRRTVAALAPRLIGDGELARFGDPKRMFLNVNNFDDLRRTAAILER